MFYNEVIITDKSIIVKIVTGIKVEDNKMLPIYKTNKFLRSRYIARIEPEPSDVYIRIEDKVRRTSYLRHDNLRFPKTDTIIIDRTK